ncbi:MAG TPA: lyase family protein [Acidimicrobiia bacterium]|nr:lyase family protein [Acidimicrobiia bacterium]
MSGSPLSFWGFSTPTIDRIFSADGVVKAIMRFEGALAEALGEVGIAPEDEAKAVAAVCEEPVGDPDRLLRSTWEMGSPLIVLVEVIRSRLDDDDQRRWVHYGATTQDAIDTVHMLAAKEALGYLDDGLATVCRIMRDLVVAYRDQPHLARTFLQDAQPTTFGLRVAGWLQPTLTHLETLRETRATLAVQLGGPVGNLATYGPKGTAVVESVARRLDLRPPDLAWHTDRSRIRALVAAVLDPVSTLAKVATDVGLLAQSAIGEVTVRPGGSSSIASKENPIDAIRALAAADVCTGAAAMITRARPHELDRAMGSWHTEWVALPMVFSSASAVVEAISSLLGSLEVDREVMASGVDKPPDIEPGLIDRILDRCAELV